MNRKVLALLTIPALVMFSPLLYWPAYWWFGLLMPAVAAQCVGFGVTLLCTILGVACLGLYPLFEGKYPWE